MRPLMEQWYVLLSLPKPCSLLFNSTRCEALVLPSVFSAAKGKGANQTRKRAQVPGSIPSSKPMDTIPTSWTSQLWAAPVLPILGWELWALLLPVHITAASVSPHWKAAALIPLKAHHSLYLLAFYFLKNSVLQCQLPISPLLISHTRRKASRCAFHVPWPVSGQYLWSHLFGLCFELCNSNIFSVKNGRLLVFSINIWNSIWVVLPQCSLVSAHRTGRAAAISHYCCVGSAAAPHRVTPDEDGICFWPHPDLLLQNILPSLHF